MSRLDPEPLLRLRQHFETDVWWGYRKIFIEVICEQLVRLLDYRGLMGDPALALHLVPLSIHLVKSKLRRFLLDVIFLYQFQK